MSTLLSALVYAALWDVTFRRALVANVILVVILVCAAIVYVRVTGPSEKA